jgi:hypothetical protein
MAFLALAPATLATISGIGGLIGAGATAAGTIAGGEATANAANFQAQVAHNNAIIEEQNANYALQAGRAQATATSLKGAATAGKIKTAQAANNVNTNTGSAVDVQESARETGKLDTETVLNNAELQYYGYRTQAVSDTAESELQKSKADEAVPGSILAASGGLLSSASAIGFKLPGGGPNAPFNLATTPSESPQ